MRLPRHIRADLAATGLALLLGLLAPEPAVAGGVPAFQSHVHRVAIPAPRPSGLYAASGDGSCRGTGRYGAPGRGAPRPCARHDRAVAANHVPSGATERATPGADQPPPHVSDPANTTYVAALTDGSRHRQRESSSFASVGSGDRGRRLATRSGDAGGAGYVAAAEGVFHDANAPPAAASLRI